MYNLLSSRSTAILKLRFRVKTTLGRVKIYLVLSFSLEKRFWSSINTLAAEAHSGIFMKMFEMDLPNVVKFSLATGWYMRIFSCMVNAFIKTYTSTDMLHNFRRSKLLENWNSSIIFEVETKYKVHLTQKLTGLKFKMASLSVKRSSVSHAVCKGPLI